MYSQIDISKLKRPGQYALGDIQLVSYSSADGSATPKRVSIKTQVLEINIQESINHKTLSGSIVVVDAQNIPNHLPLTGHERLEFKLFTPGTSRGFDFTSETGNPMYIYKIEARQGLGPRVQTYILHFCSKEMIRNELKRVNQSFDENIDDIILSILRTQLESKKTFFLEQTRDARKIVMPRMRPFDSIQYLCNEAQSGKFESAGMYFYETALGFHLRSLESLLAITDGSARPVVAKFVDKPKSIKGGTGENDIIKDMQIVDGYSIDSQFDTLQNLRNGVNGSKCVIHDALYKTFDEYEFDYHKFFEKSFHTEHDGEGGKTSTKSILPLYNDGTGHILSDYKDGKIYYQSTTSNIHNDQDRFNIADIITKREAQKKAFESQKISLQCRGFTGLSAGDIISFELPAYEPVGSDNPLDRDPYMSGRYLVSHIRHKIDTANDYHTMALTCMKDSVRVGYPEENIDTTTGRELSDPLTVLQYELDKSILDNANAEGQNTILT